MPIGVITESEFEQEVVRLVDMNKGRGNKKAVPTEIAALAAQEVMSGASASDISEALGISPSSVSAYKKDARSTASYDSPDKDLKEKNDAFRNKIKSLASDKLVSAIEAITEEKLENARANVASAIARDMSQVIKNVTPDVNEVQHNQVIIYKPRMKDEDDYEVIDIQRVEA